MRGLKHTADKRKIKLAHIAHLQRKKEAGIRLSTRELKELRRG